MSPFELAELPAAYRTPEGYMQSFKVGYAEACAMVKVAARGKIFINDVYQVNVSPPFTPPGEWPWPEMIHLSIKRRDRECARDWRELQIIKNTFVGPENDGMEIYPAESRLVDMANQFHLWVFTDPKVRIPTGWNTRTVFNEVHAEQFGATQREITSLDDWAKQQEQEQR